MRTIAAMLAAAGLLLAGSIHAPARADWDNGHGHGGPPRHAEWHHDGGHREAWGHDDWHHGDWRRDEWHGEGWHHEGWHAPPPWAYGYAYAPPVEEYYAPPAYYYPAPYVPLPPVLSFGITIP